MPFLVVKTIIEYSFLDLGYSFLKLPVSQYFIILISDGPLNYHIGAISNNR